MNLNARLKNPQISFLYCVPGCHLLIATLAKVILFPMRPFSWKVKYLKKADRDQKPSPFMGKCCRMVLLHRRLILELILEQSTVYLPHCNWRTVCPFRLPTAEDPALSPQDCVACRHLSLWQSFFPSNYYIGCLRAYCSVQACYAQVPNIMQDDV